MALFRRHQGEAGRKVEAHLMAEDAFRADAGAIPLLDAFFEDSTEQLQIGPHAELLSRRSWPVIDKQKIERGKSRPV
jgi:hypothetical protein